MKRSLYERLRALFGKREADVEAACFVPGCSGAPLLVLAATERCSIHACSEHAAQWLASDDGRVARADQGSVIPVLRRWAAKRGIAGGAHLSKPHDRPVPA